MAEGRYLHFAAGRRRLALPMVEVREVAEIRSLVPVPGAPKVVGGLAEIRGRIVTILDPSADDPASDLPAGAPPSSLFVAIFSEPLDHLGVLVYGLPETARATEGPPHADAPGNARTESWLLPGGDIHLTGGHRAALLDPRRLAEHASECVRKQFLVGPE